MGAPKTPPVPLIRAAPVLQSFGVTLAPNKSVVGRCSGNRIEQLWRPRESQKHPRGRRYVGAHADSPSYTLLMRALLGMVGAVLCYDGEAGAVALPSEEAEPRDKGLDWTSVGTCWFSSFAGVLQWCRPPRRTRTRTLSSSASISPPPPCHTGSPRSASLARVVIWCVCWQRSKVDAVKLVLRFVIFAWDVSVVLTGRPLSQHFVSVPDPGAQVRVLALPVRHTTLHPSPPPLYSPPSPPPPYSPIRYPYSPIVLAARAAGLAPAPFAAPALAPAYHKFAYALAPASLNPPTISGRAQEEGRCVGVRSRHSLARAHTLHTHACTHARMHTRMHVHNMHVRMHAHVHACICAVHEHVHTCRTQCMRMCPCVGRT